MNKGYLIAPVVAAMLLSGGIQAKPHDRPMDDVFRQLNLTEQQRSDMRTLMHESREEGQLYKDDMQQIKQQLEVLVKSANFDQKSVQALLEQRQALKDKVALSRAINRNQIWQQLNDTQQQKFVEATAKTEYRHRRHSHRNPMHTLVKLDLSGPQQQQIEQLISQHKADSEPLQKQLSDFNQAQAQITRSSEFDQQAWQEVHEQAQAVHMQLSMSKMTTRQKIWQLLDEQQQQKWQDIQQQRIDKFRHKRTHRRAAM